MMCNTTNLSSHALPLDTPESTRTMSAISGLAAKEMRSQPRTAYSPSGFPTELRGNQSSTIWRAMIPLGMTHHTLWPSFRVRKIHPLHRLNATSTGRNYSDAPSLMLTYPKT